MGNTPPTPVEALSQVQDVAPAQPPVTSSATPSLTAHSPPLGTPAEDEAVAAAAAAAAADGGGRFRDEAEPSGVTPPVATPVAAPPPAMSTPVKLAKSNSVTSSSSITPSKLATPRFRLGNGDKIHQALQQFGRELQCSICLSTFNNPYSLKCGHTYCRECILQAINVQRCCPICKAPTDRRELNHNGRFHRIVDHFNILLPPLPMSQSTVGTQASSNWRDWLQHANGPAASTTAGAAASSSASSHPPQPSSSDSDAPAAAAATTSITGTTTTGAPLTVRDPSPASVLLAPAAALLSPPSVPGRGGRRIQTYARSKRSLGAVSASLRARVLGSAAAPVVRQPPKHAAPTSMGGVGAGAGAGAGAGVGAGAFPLSTPPPEAQLERGDDSDDEKACDDVFSEEEFDLNLDGGPQDDVCVVCLDAESYVGNEILYCDGCDVAVHLECYGIAKVPPADSQWFCTACESGKNPARLKCDLCPVTGPGHAFKPVLNGGWAHVVCAIWIPETVFKNPDTMEPIVTKSIDKRRWKLKCGVCDTRGKGVAVQCSWPRCSKPFHPMCGLQNGLFMKVESASNENGVAYKRYCTRHTAEARAQARLRLSSQRRKRGKEAAGGGAALPAAAASAAAVTPEQGTSTSRKKGNASRPRARRKRHRSDSQSESDSESEDDDIAGGAQGKRKGKGKGKGKRARGRKRAKHKPLSFQEQLQPGCIVEVWRDVHMEWAQGTITATRAPSCVSMTGEDAQSVGDAQHFAVTFDADREDVETMQLCESNCHILSRASQHGEQVLVSTFQANQCTLLATSLPERMKAQLQQLESLLGIQVVSDFSEQVTHVVCGTTTPSKSAKGGATVYIARQRTVKYLNALLSGKWIVSEDWIKACLKHGMVVQEAPYEVAADRTLRASRTQHSRVIGGPQRARTRSTPLLEGYRVFLQGDFAHPKPSRALVRDMVERAGGEIVGHPKHLLGGSQSSAGKRIVICATNSFRLPRDMSELVARGYVRAVAVVWLLDSISAWRVASADDAHYQVKQTMKVRHSFEPPPPLPVQPRIPASAAAAAAGASVSAAASSDARAVMVPAH